MYSPIPPAADPRLSSMEGPRPPFTTPVLGEPKEQQGFTCYLPAAHRTKKDHIVVPQADADFLGDELLVNKINAVQDWLWTCGRPMPPRPLHHQVLLSREVTITENPELHLLWSNNRIFLKPLPSWLLDPLFWTSHILQDADLARCARGFLFSYTALISYESDFRLAQEKGLLPPTLEWEGWKRVVKEVLQNHDMALVNPRYWYGELRLGRLNAVYRFKGSVFRGYSKVSGHATYADLVADNVAVLATVLGYVVIVLTSLQVGLGVDRLLENTAFINFSYGFTVFSILAPVIAGFGIFLFVIAMFISNWLVTKKYEELRFREMGVEPYWRDKPGKTPAGSLTKRNPSRSDSQGGV
ncbi:hypothetical protein O1611_g10189 [Lasiodiplodia mahajangana]|uniref:Uncharacterized protein n=1 Tax=Lasiodiplodia mahajangana TaxID=1108764 RepID=A0ACC2J138_9PEZI|nr:hypothetical protein O1611_g10189 [Lasiodiplodia mahajangana]